MWPSIFAPLFGVQPCPCLLWSLVSCFVCVVYISFACFSLFPPFFFCQFLATDLTIQVLLSFVFHEVTLHHRHSLPGAARVCVRCAFHGRLGSHRGQRTNKSWSLLNVVGDAREKPCFSACPRRPGAYLYAPNFGCAAVVETVRSCSCILCVGVLCVYVCLCVPLCVLVYLCVVFLCMRGTYRKGKRKAQCDHGRFDCTVSAPSASHVKPCVNPVIHTRSRERPRQQRL